MGHLCILEFPSDLLGPHDSLGFLVGITNPRLDRLIERLELGAKLHRRVVHATPSLIDLYIAMRHNQVNMPETYILDVMPLVFIPRNQAQVVSYYHSVPLPRGTVVETLFNNRKIKAVVVESVPLKSRKLAFKKQADFTLKKISRVVKTKSLVSDNQLKIAEYLYLYYYAPLGLSLKTVLSKKSKISPTIEILHLFPEHVQAKHFETKSGEAADTRSALFVPFTNLKKIIVHDEANEFYKSDMTPRYHAVNLAREIARLYGAQFEIADSPVPHQESWIEIIDMVRELRDANFSIFSRDLKESLFRAQEKKEHAILFIPRRGYASSFSCQTCGKPIQCPNCSVSLVLHQAVKPLLSGFTAQLICHHCDYNQTRPKQCPACGSHALKSHGIGIDKVVTELKKLFTYQNLAIPLIFKLDSDTTGNDDAKEAKIIAEFQNSKPAILVATSILLSYRDLISAPFIGIINADTLIHIPDYRAEEALLRQTLLLGSMTEYLIVQTYNPDDPALVAATTGKSKEFMDGELENRKQFGYPPFVQLVKLTNRNRNEQLLRRNATALAQQLGGTAYPALISRERGLYVWNVLLKLKIKSQISKMDKKEELQQRNRLLSQVPPDWSIDIDPKTIL